MDREIEKKEGLLKDIETVKDLKIMPLSHYKERLIECRDFSLKYRDGKEHVITGLNFELKQGDRVFLKGKNGCGKSSLIKYILTQNLQNSSNGGIEKRKITMSGCENLSGENIMATGTCLPYPACSIRLATCQLPSLCPASTSQTLHRS